MTFRADAFDLDGAGAGKVQAGAASVVLTPNTVTNTLAVVSPAVRDDDGGAIRPRRH
jgi:hypothetical protein